MMIDRPKFVKVVTSDELCVFIDHFGCVPISWDLSLVYHLKAIFEPAQVSSALSLILSWHLFESHSSKTN